MAVFGILENEGFYSYHSQMLGFSPEAVQQANGNVRPYIYEIIDLIGLSDQVKRVAVAYIPDSDKAKEELTTWLHPKSMRAQLDSLMHTKSILPQCSYMCTMVNADQLKSVSSSTDILYCYPVSCSEGDIIVEGSVPGDGGSDFDWPSADTDGSSDSNSGGASSNTGEGASGAPCPPPYECGSPEQAPDEDDSEENEDTPDEDPCETGDEIIDNEKLQLAFALLWQGSNTTAPIEQRTEQGGFIITDGNDYNVLPFPPDWQRTACSINPPNDYADDIPENTVGLVHTHPFFSGENTTSDNVCGPRGNDNYSSGISDDDHYFLIAVMNSTNNYSMKSYVLDGNNILSIDLLRKISNYERCGY